MMVDHQILDRVRIDRRDLLNIERLRQAMVRNDLDAVIASSEINVTYTSGIHKPVRSPQLITFVVTTSDSEAGIVIGEADRYCEEYSWIEDIRYVRYGTSLLQSNLLAVSLLVEMLIEKGLANARLGIEKAHIPALYWEELARHLPNATLEDGSDAFTYARLVKTPAEIELYRTAAYYTAKAIDTAFAQVRPGDTEKLLASVMQSIVLRLGADYLEFLHLHAGEHSTVTHDWPLERQMKPGEIVHVDFGAVFGGYRTDIGRNAIVVSANPRQEDIYRHMWEIQQALFERMRVGATGGELYELGQKDFETRGLKYPWGTLGHSIGLSVMEDGFDLAEGSDQLLEPGMIICVEPTHIDPKLGRFRVEDAVLVKDTGIEVLSNYRPTDSLPVIK